jgi:predicted hydrolase (HD superfamily)
MLRRFKEKRFAAGASRENMAACSHLGLELPEFLGLVHAGMMSITDELGL